MQRPWGGTEPGVSEEQRGGPCGWRGVSEGEDRRAGRRWGRSPRVSWVVGRGEDLGFYPEGGGRPGGWWTEEGPDLTRVLTGALWPLQRGQMLGGQDPGGIRAEAASQFFLSSGAPLPALLQANSCAFSPHPPPHRADLSYSLNVAWDCGALRGLA